MENKKGSKYSVLTKQELIEILEFIPGYEVYTAISKLCEIVLDNQTDAYADSTKKLSILKDEIRKKGCSANLDFAISEAKKSEKTVEELEKKYEKLNALCNKLFNEKNSDEQLYL